MPIYLDNAASAPMDERVLEAMMPYFTHKFGNPSSIHNYGRETRAAVEKARRTIAEILNTSPSEIFFTSGGTEADNMAIFSCIHTYELSHVITSPLEHHAVLHTAEELQEDFLDFELSKVEVDTQGVVNMDCLEALLANNPVSLVSLMHGNNEIGNLNDIERIAALCKENEAYFHSDTVQTMGHYRFDLQKLPIHYLSASAHKFHGPKGTGFLYVSAEAALKPMLYGGPQERNMRGGTENVPGIVGMAKALELAYDHLDHDRQHITALKTRMINQLVARIPDVMFNGLSGDLGKSLYTVLNINLPPGDEYEMLLFNLDIEGIAASAGSACTSGTQVGSHVLEAIGANPDSGYLRFSFSRMNTMQEIDRAVDVLEKILKR
ncbi:MAG TPA: cysteine desulfurase family protein [Cytophagaceae bacterium]|jgi:cysteine desulfurase|nr:cysteine desulfurase family protein [Cytophagaceae bacterium]